MDRTGLLETRATARHERDADRLLARRESSPPPDRGGGGDDPPVDGPKSPGAQFGGEADTPAAGRRRDVRVRRGLSRRSGEDGREPGAGELTQGPPLHNAADDRDAPTERAAT